MSIDFVIAIGVIIVTDVVAVAVTPVCAKEDVENPRTTRAMEKSLVMFFIVLSFLKLLRVGF